MKSNEEWMEEFQQGNIDAFSVIYERLHQPLYCFLYRYTQEENLSVDIVHDSFEQLQKYKSKFNGEKGTVKSFLFQIGYRLMLNKLNRRKKWQSLVPFLIPVVAQHFDSDDRLVVQQAIAQLPDKLRAVIILAYYEDMQQEEIAHVLDIPVGTVKSRMHRAIEKLRASLKEDYYVEGRN